MNYTHQEYEKHALMMETGLIRFNISNRQFLYHYKEQINRDWKDTHGWKIIQTTWALRVERKA